MTFAIYYVVFLFVVAFGWQHLKQSGTGYLILWAVFGLAVLALPFLVPIKVAFFYGLAIDMIGFFWCADTHMLKLDRRARAFFGLVVLLPLPLAWSWPIESWLGAALVPTVGHALATGVSTTVIRRILNVAHDS